MKTQSMAATCFKLWDKSDEWLSKILKESLNLESVNVVNIEYEPLNCINGFLSQVFLLQVEYEEDLPQLPRSLILKTRHSDSYNRDMAKELKAFQGEVSFYDEFANRCELNTPRCYYSYVDKKTCEGFLLLEDLSSYPGGDQIHGVSLKDSMATLKQIGKLHAQFWNSPDLYDFDNLPENEYVLAHDFRLGWDSFIEDKGYLLSDYQKELGNLLVTKMQSVLFVAKYRPQSLIHSDLRADNLRYQSGVPGTMNILDWQLASIGIPAFDFVRFVCGSRNNLPRDVEKLAYVWMNSLQVGGVKDYSIKECIFDIRLALLIALHIPVVFHNRLDKKVNGRNSRLHKLTRILIRRYFSIAETLDVMSVLKRV